MVARLFLLTMGFLQLALSQTFEVASIRASQFQSADGEGGRAENINVSGDRLTMRNVTLRSCISWAYNLQDFQVAGDLGVDRFDITAKAAAPSTIRSCPGPASHNTVIAPTYPAWVSAQ